MRIKVVQIAAVTVLAAQATCAFGAPNGLTQIPIAKVFGDGVASFSVERAMLQTQDTVFTTQYGVSNKLEFGIDYQSAPSDERTFLGNIKYLVAHSPGKLPDIAVGLQNIATGQQAAPYLVATTQPRATGITLGLIRPSGGSAYDGMAGISYNVSPTFQFVADYIGGSSSYATIGVIDNLTKELEVNVAYAAPNTAGNETDGFNPRGYIFNIAYTFHLRGGEGGEKASNAKNPASNPGGH